MTVETTGALPGVAAPVTAKGLMTRSSGGHSVAGSSGTPDREMPLQSGPAGDAVCSPAFGGIAASAAATSTVWPLQGTTRFR